MQLDSISPRILITTETPNNHWPLNRTHHPALVEDESSESILYDRYKPSSNLVYDAVPNLPKITAAGRLAPMGWERAWVLFLPMFWVMVNGVYLVMG